MKKKNYDKFGLSGKIGSMCINRYEYKCNFAFDAIYGHALQQVQKNLNAASGTPNQN
jgi:hypothetical protein